MSAPEGNKNAAKPAAEKRQAPAIYLRPTPAERKEIMRWAGGEKLSRKCLAAILSVVRGIHLSSHNDLALRQPGAGQTTQTKEKE